MEIPCKVNIWKLEKEWEDNIKMGLT